jgi:multiple antibiotic resistance protein
MPFAFPLLVGPAEISIVINLSNPGWLSKILLAVASMVATDRVNIVDGQRN